MRYVPKLTSVVLGSRNPATQCITDLNARYPNFKTAIQVSSYDEEIYFALLAGYAINGSSNIAAAWKAIAAFFEASSRATEEYKNSFSNYLLTKLSVVTLTVPESMDLHAVFETLNGRGKPLTELDMLKNFFLSQVNKGKDTSNLTVVQNSFETIYSYFSTNKRITSYLRCQLQARHGFLPEKQFYRAVKSSLSRMPPKNLRNHVEELASVEMGLYMLVLKPLRHVSEINTITKRANRRQSKRTLIDYLLDLSNYSVVHPILLALFIRYTGSRKRISVSFLLDACRNLSSFVMRMVYTRAAFQPSLYEREFAQLANQVYTGKCADIRKFQIALLQLDQKGTVANITNDEMFVSILSSISIKHLQKAKQLLMSVENYGHRGTVMNSDAVRVEHILPHSGKLHDSWSQFSESQRDLFSHRLGNICLLEAGLAKPELRGASLHKKLKVYAASGLHGTQAVSLSDEWHPKAICERQLSLAQCASVIWSFA